MYFSYLYHVSSIFKNIEVSCILYLDTFFRYLTQPWIQQWQIPLTMIFPEEIETKLKFTSILCYIKPIIRNNVNVENIITM
jgi:hypothetical protein